MGAKYHSAHEYKVTLSTDGTVIPANATRIFGLTEVTAGNDAGRIILPRAGVAVEMWVISFVAPGAGETFDYTLRVNGVNQALTCQTAGAAAIISNDLVNAVNINAGDWVTIEITTSLNAAATYHSVSFMVRH